MNGINGCGAYIERLQREHREINGAILGIRHLLSELPGSAKPQMAQSEVAQRLEELLTCLRGHFAEEEEDGCLEEAVTRLPSTSADVRAILAEHPGLAQTLKRLVAGAKSRTLTIAELQTEFDDFARRLKVHEVKENRLLQFALGGQATDYDTEGNE